MSLLLGSFEPRRLGSVSSFYWGRIACFRAAGRGNTGSSLWSHQVLWGQGHVCKDAARSPAGRDRWQACTEVEKMPVSAQGGQARRVTPPAVPGAVWGAGAWEDRVGLHFYEFCKFSERNVRSLFCFPINLDIFRGTGRLRCIDFPQVPQSAI